MPGANTTRALRTLAAVLALVAAGAAPELGGADRAADLRARAGELKADADSLSGRSHAALLELYAVEAQLARSRERLSALETRIAGVREERAVAARRLGGARRTLAAAQRGLADRVRALYQRGDVDAFSVLLGAESFDDALTTLEHVNRMAEQDRQVAGEARTARLQLERLARVLALRERRLARLRDAAQAAAAALEQARAERSATVVDLERRAELTREAISSLEAQARVAQERASELTVSQTTTSSSSTTTSAAPATPPAPVGTGEAQLTVVATAYALRGTTATGIPVGPRVVAVDPSVIPLGTQMTIPGYGEGFAADTGGAIVGARIDVWVPTEAQAQAWGVRTVTITIHGG